MPSLPPSTERGQVLGTAQTKDTGVNLLLKLILDDILDPLINPLSLLRNDFKSGDDTLVLDFCDTFFKTQEDKCYNKYKNKDQY